LTNKKRIILIVSIIIGGAAAAVLYGLFDPAKYAFFPKCPFVILTGGLRCPGCGSQRALHALLHLDVKDAFLYNPMVIISIPFLILLITASIFKDTHPGFYKKLNSSLLIKLLLVLIIFWWIFRNIAGI
jgi:hypothetical protein